jgi:aspartate beta-hydroxylase
MFPMSTTLASAPTTVEALLDQADRLAADGDARAASAHYAAAIKQSQLLEKWPAGLADRLAVASDACAHYTSSYTKFLYERLAAAGFDAQRTPGRFADSLEILLGKKQLFLQQPRFYYFPGLPQIQFYENTLFPWIADVERATPAIRAELLSLLADQSVFAPYVQGKVNRPVTRESEMRNNPAWSACFLWKDGNPVAEIVARCPETMRVLSNVPLARIPDRSPSILFSMLRAGARIPPHNGLINTRLICHLPLIVPGPTSFRVGNEVRSWVEGKAWLFDDTIEHEAWNGSDQDRVVLLFDVWRPELTSIERALVVRLFGAIDAYDGKKPEWEI